MMDHKMTRREALAFIRKAGLAAAAAGAVPWALFDKIGAGNEWISQAAAGSLPTNYRISTGQLLADTSVGLAGLVSHGIQTGNAVWSVTEVTTPSFLRPISSPPSKIFRLAVTTPASVAGLYQMTWAVSIQPRTISQILMISRGENLGAATPEYSILLGDDASFTNFWISTKSFNSTNGHQDIWRYNHTFRQAMSVGGGSPNPDNTFIRFRVRVGAGIGESPIYYVCPTYMNVVSKPIVTIGFDDGYLTDFTEAYAYMQPRRIPGYSAVTSGILGGRNTVGNLHVMQDNGWSIHNHAETHTNFTTLTEPQMVSEVETCRNFLIQNGLHSGSLAFIYPQGGRNALSDSVLSRYYPYTCAPQLAEQSIWDGIPEPLQIGRYPMDNPATASSVIAAVNAAINTNQSINLFGHNPAASAPVGQTDIATSRPVIDHVMKLRDANVIQVRNLQSMLKGLTSPRRLRG